MASPYDNNMPTTYQARPVQSTYSEPYDLGFFARPEAGWLKIVEAVVGLITFICATVEEDFVKHWGGGWVQFVSITSMLLTIIIIIFYVFFIFEKLPHNLPSLLIETIYAGLVSLLYFTCGITAAVKGDRDAAIGAAAFFSFAGMAVYGIDAFVLFMRWRASHGGTDPVQGASTSGPNTVTTPGGNVGTTEMPPGVYPGNITADQAEAGKTPY